MKKQIIKSKFTIPDWLIKLPKGDYCIPELCERTGLSYHAIYQKLMAMEIPNYKKNIELGKGVNRLMVFYTWDGFKAHSKKINEKRLKEIGGDK